MTTYDQITRRGMALAMIAAPLLWLGSTLAVPTGATGDRAIVAAIAQHPTRWYWFALLVTLGSMAVVPALLGITRLLRERAPRLALAGGLLAQFGALVSLVDSGNQLVVWQIGAPGADRAQMVALLTRLDAAAGASVLFSVGGLAIVVGMVLLAVGLARTRTAPVWAAACLPLGTIVNIAGFAAGSRAAVGASCVILLAGFLPLARLTAPRASAASAPRAVPRPAR
jgi:hypothetical protein